MTQDANGQNTRHSTTIKNLARRGTETCKHLVGGVIIPRSRQYARLGIKTCREHLAPRIKTGATLVGNELKKIHRRENWSKRCSTTLFDNTLGLGLGMLAGNIVQNSVEVERFGNLWGLLASKPVVSESTYEVLNFSVEFAITLLVFTISEHYIGAYRNRQHENGHPVEERT